jgi:quercetin dioxygenase-like cupin family protein
MIIDGVDRVAGALPEDYRAHFAGQAHFQQLASPFEGGPDVFIVHFDAGGRTRPHVHHKGQVLHVVSGEGVVADRDGRHVVSPGDTVTVSADEWHWHGALPHTAMSHFTVQHRGADVSWDVEEGDWAIGYEA